MRKFIVTNTISIQIEVEATDIDDATDIAAMTVSDILESNNLLFEYIDSSIVQEIDNHA